MHRVYAQASSALNLKDNLGSSKKLLLAKLEFSLKIDPNLSDDAVLSELGFRLRERRLSRNISQDRLAHEAGVSAPTINKLESGKPVQLVTLVRVLRVLDLLGGLERAIPEPSPSPIEMLRHSEGKRRRASRSTAVEPSSRPQAWRWGDEG
jgi:transcriptional regulator with XRE-family HTH domain